MTQQTPCQELGYEIGDKFTVITDGENFQLGAVVELCEDDGSDCPKFILLSGHCKVFGAPHGGRPAAFTSLNNVRKIEPAEEPIENESSLNVLLEANEIIYGDREQTHGKPSKNLRHIAEQWSLYLQQRHDQMVFISPEDVCYMMADLKKCRQMNSHNRDNLVDGCGYLGLIERL